jgi:hypothetical protein
VRPGTGIRPGTWQAGPDNGTGSDFSGNGTGSGGGNRNLFMWIGAGLIGVTILAAAVILVLSSGNGGSGSSVAAAKSPKAATVDNVALQPGSMELQAGQKRKFIVEITPQDAPHNVRWESDDPSVAYVQDGEVWAQKPGQTTVRAVSMQDATKQGSAEIIVSGAVASDMGQMDRPVDKPIVKPVKDPTPVVKPGPTGQNKPPPPPDDEDDTASKNFVSDKPVEKPAPVKAVLTISSAPPFAEVIVDGRFMGTTPVKDKELTPGRHKLQITHRNFPPVDTVINLGPGEKKIHFRLFRQ